MERGGGKDGKGRRGEYSGRSACAGTTRGGERRVSDRLHLCILHPQKMRCAKYCVRLNKLAINRRLRVAQVMKWNLSYEEEKVSQHNPMVVYFRIIMYSFTPLVSKRGAGAS